MMKEKESCIVIAKDRWLSKLTTRLLEHPTARSVVVFMPDGIHGETILLHVTHWSERCQHSIEQSLDIWTEWKTAQESESDGDDFIRMFCKTFKLAFEQLEEIGPLVAYETGEE